MVKPEACQKLAGGRSGGAGEHPRKTSQGTPDPKTGSQLRHRFPLVNNTSAIPAGVGAILAHTGGISGTDRINPRLMAQNPPGFPCRCARPSNCRASAPTCHGRSPGRRERLPYKFLPAKHFLEPVRSMPS